MPDQGSKPTVTLSVKDIKQIKEAAFQHIHDVFPKNLDHKELQILLICKGFINFLGQKNISIAANFKYEWEKNIKS